jgi:flagellar biosynthesis protein FliQ
MMDDGLLLLVQEALRLAVILSAPPVCAAFLMSLFVRIVQASTQIQGPTIAFVPRALVVLATLFFSGAWMATEIQLFATRTFEWIGRV